MSEEDRRRWDARYRDNAYRDRLYPSQIVEHWLPKLPNGTALDIACGAGRNAIYLAKNGYQVDAFDISGVAIAFAEQRARSEGVSIRWQVADIDNGLPSKALYDLILMVRCVNLSIVRASCKQLRPSGVILIENHLDVDDLPMALSGPLNPLYRVRPDSTMLAVQGLECLFSYEGIVDEPDGSHAAVAQVIARKPTTVPVQRA